MHKIKPLTFMLWDHKVFIGFVIAELPCARLRALKVTKLRKINTRWQSRGPLFYVFQKCLVKRDLPHTWLSPPPPSLLPFPASLHPSLPPSLGSKSLRGTDTKSTIHHSSRCDSQTALLSWLNCSHASYAGADLHLCSVSHPEGIEKL